jgi:hypothetical protein
MVWEEKYSVPSSASNPTATLYLALSLSPLSMCKIGIVITPLQPGHQREDVCNLRQPQG